MKDFSHLFFIRRSIGGAISLALALSFVVAGGSCIGPLSSF